MRTWLSRLVDVVLRRSREDRLGDEVESHLQMLADELASPPRNPDRWPVPRQRTEAVAEVAGFLEAVVARRNGLIPVGV